MSIDKQNITVKDVSSYDPASNAFLVTFLSGRTAHIKKSTLSTYLKRQHEIYMPKINSKVQDFMPKWEQMEDIVHVYDRTNGNWIVQLTNGQQVCITSQRAHRQLAKQHIHPTYTVEYVKGPRVVNRIGCQKDLIYVQVKFKGFQVFEWIPVKNICPSVLRKANLPTSRYLRLEQKIKQ